MKYLTKPLLQMFIKNMSKNLHSLQQEIKEIESIVNGWSRGSPWRSKTEYYKLLLNYKYAFNRLSVLQKFVKTAIKSDYIRPSTLQQMEAVVTQWLISLDWDKLDAERDYKKSLKTEDETLYWNILCKRKLRLAKMVKLQQAIRKQKKGCRLPGLAPASTPKNW